MINSNTEAQICQDTPLDFLSFRSRGTSEPPDKLDKTA